MTADDVRRDFDAAMAGPRMLPGQEPYTNAELVRLYAALGAAADGDPGETDEPIPADSCSSLTCSTGCDHPAAPHYPSSAELAAFRRRIWRYDQVPDLPGVYLAGPPSGGAYGHEIREGIGHQDAWTRRAR